MPKSASPSGAWDVVQANDYPVGGLSAFSGLMPPGVSRVMRIYTGFSSALASAKILPLRTLGRRRLDKIKAMLGTGQWRTERLELRTIELAEKTLRIFEEELGFEGPQPRIAPSKDGGIGFEWRQGSRELLFEISSNDRIDWLKVEDGKETEGEGPAADLARDLARWLKHL